MYYERTSVALFRRANVFLDFVCRSGLVPQGPARGMCWEDLPWSSCSFENTQILSKKQLLPWEDAASLSGKG